MTSTNGATPSRSDETEISPAATAPLAGRERAATIALLATHPAVVAGRALQALSKDAPDIGALVNVLEERLSYIESGDTRTIRAILGSQTFILQALVEHCAWRLGAVKNPEGARVYGTLLLAAQRQSCQTVELLQSIDLPQSEPENSNELLVVEKHGARMEQGT